MHCASNNVSGRRPRFRAERGGFTFAEVLAAMVFLAVLVPVVIEGLTLANRAAEVAERKTIATQLAANKLNEIVITEAWSATNSSGDFGEVWPGFRWESTSRTWSEDAMTELAVVVTYAVQGRDYTVTLSTLVDTSTS
ncbi:MAG: type II secretion system protein [Verrucomicrobiales bacterium]|nr:type II secretion system protein [Verrucomicrobiales bacterium]